MYENGGINMEMSDSERALCDKESEMNDKFDGRVCGFFNKVNDIRDKEVKMLGYDLDNERIRGRIEAYNNIIKLFNVDGI